MSTKRQNLPGIIEIRCINKYSLEPNILHRSFAGLPIGIFTDQTTAIDFVDVAEIELKTTEDNHRHVEEANLKFLAAELSEEISNPDNRFLARQAGGQWYLMGYRESLAPESKTTQKIAKPSGDASAYEVEISFKDIKALIPVNVF